VLQLLCDIIASGVPIAANKSATATVTDLTVTAASTQIYAGGGHDGAFLYNPNMFSVWVNFASPAVVNGPMEVQALSSLPLQVGPTLYTGPVWGIHSQVGDKTIQVIKVP